MTGFTNVAIAIANTGVAGPDDAPAGTRAGTAYFTWGHRRVEPLRFSSVSRR